MILLWIIIALLLGSVGSVALTGTLLYFDDIKLRSMASYLTSLAGGTLLGAAFLGMMSTAMIHSGFPRVLKITLGGIVFFFILEKSILWHACYRKECPRRQNASAQLILVGDGFHNFIDGVAITAAFLSSAQLGVVVTLSVFAHEIPQELADFGVLVKNGYTPKKAFIYNMLSGLTAIFGGIISYFALDSMQHIIPWVLSLSAASFIYIALADLVPQMHEKTSLRDSILQIVLILSGIVIIYLFKNIA